MVSVFGFVNGSYCFFGIRTRGLRRGGGAGSPVGTGTSGSGSGSSCFVSGDLLGAARAEQAVRRPGAVEVGLLRDLGVAELVLVARGDVDDAGSASRLHEARHGRPCLLRAGEVELAARLDEVDLRVDVPEDRPAHDATVRTSPGKLHTETSVRSGLPAPRAAIVGERLRPRRPRDRSACDQAARLRSGHSPHLGERDRVNWQYFIDDARSDGVDSASRAACAVVYGWGGAGASARWTTHVHALRRCARTTRYRSAWSI